MSILLLSQILIVLNVADAQSELYTLTLLYLVPSSNLTDAQGFVHLGYFSRASYDVSVPQVYDIAT